MLHPWNAVTHYIALVGQCSSSIRPCWGGGNSMIVRTSRAVLCASIAGLLLGAIPAAAQITTGTVSGTIKDSTGGVIPGATVVLVSEARGTKSVPAVTNETGDYVLPNITPDTYTLEVTMDGFRTVRRTGVIVTGGERVSVP